MKTNMPSYRGYRFPREIISHAVWLYHGFCLSFRDVEDLLAQRGRHSQLRNHPTVVAELFVTIQGQRQYLWRAIDQDGEVIDILIQPRRDQRAAERFFRKLLKGQESEPRRLVIDKLRTYEAARRVIMPSVVHDTERYANNRAEISHDPVRPRERQMRGFKSVAQAQRFWSIQNLFRVGRHLLRSVNHRLLRSRAFLVWQEVTCAG
jgi:putative transposase